MKRAHVIRCLLSTSGKVECVLYHFTYHKLASHTPESLDRYNYAKLAAVSQGDYRTQLFSLFTSSVSRESAYGTFSISSKSESSWELLSAFNCHLFRKGEDSLVYFITFYGQRLGGEHSRRVLHWGPWRLSVFMAPIPWSPTWSFLSMSQAKPFFTSMGFDFFLGIRAEGTVATEGPRRNTDLVAMEHSSSF